MESATLVGPPLAALNRLRRNVDDACTIAAEAARASSRSESRLNKASAAFAALRDEVASLALDLSEIRRELTYASRDALADRLAPRFAREPLSGESLVELTPEGKAALSACGASGSEVVV